MTQIGYEVTSLENAPDIHAFQLLIQRSQWGDDTPAMFAPNASRREIRLFSRNQSKWYRGQAKNLSSKQMTHRFITFEREVRSRELARALRVDKQTLLAVISAFPRLKTIRLTNSAKCQHSLSERFQEPFSTLPIFPTIKLGSHLTVDALYNLLRALSKAESAICYWWRPSVLLPLFQKGPSSSRDSRLSCLQLQR